MKIKAVKGTRDYLPQQVLLRNYIEKTILNSYEENGFMRISTPIIESIENLDKSDGGENLNLIFKILKRGEKLTSALENGESLSDIGLRYDLTLPLVRYYSANKQNLLTPFKCIQIDKVYRAERPQKDRLREFVQCDIDIIGDKSTDCEIELILSTAKALKRLNIGKFSIKINDRQILNKLILSFGFKESQLNPVCITLDKLDKIGIDGVDDELKSKGFSEKAIAKLDEFFRKEKITIEDLSALFNDDICVSNLKEIIKISTNLANGEYQIDFDISLVRGQGYYTGTIFEVYCENSISAVAGGGRYDNLIEKFTGGKVPACGFSIGFERIYSILENSSERIDNSPNIAVIYENFNDSYNLAEILRRKYNVTFFRQPKNLKAFVDKLYNNGYDGFIRNNSNITWLKD